MELLTGNYPSPEKQREGTNILKNLFDKGNIDAGMFLANAYLKGIQVDKEEEKAIKIIEKLAESQYPEALYKIGTVYFGGGYSGYTENKPLAKEYFKKAAAKGYPAAYASLGQMAEESKQYSEAIHWYKKGLLSKDLQSMNRLASMYKLGKGLEQPNYDEAARIYYLILSSPEYEHSKFYSVYENFYTIGNKVPLINVTTFKPILNQLLEGASNNFKQLKREETETIDWDKSSIDFSAKPAETSYKCALDLGFKNGVIVKTVQPVNLNLQSSSKLDSSFRYQADVIFYTTPSKSTEVFKQWVSLLKQIYPGNTGIEALDKSNNLYFTMPVLMPNGKQIKILLEVAGQKSNRVVFKILE